LIGCELFGDGLVASAGPGEVLLPLHFLQLFSRVFRLGSELCASATDPAGNERANHFFPRAYQVIFFGLPGMAERGMSLDTWPVGTGPFMVTDYRKDRRIVMTRNPNYRGEPYPCEGSEEDLARRGVQGLGRCGVEISAAGHGLKSIRPAAGTHPRIRGVIRLVCR